MSLAYAEGKDGRLQVAYEAMDKVSIFKNTDGWWLWYCPCHDKTSHHATSQAAWFDADFGVVKHLTDWHSDDD